VKNKNNKKKDNYIKNKKDNIKGNKPFLSSKKEKNKHKEKHNNNMNKDKIF
jgi:hypothetical protein